MAQVRHGAVLVVGQRLDDYGDPAWSLAFVGQLLIGHAIEQARATLDSPLDVVVRDVGALCFLDSDPEAGVARRIRPPQLGRDGDLLEDLGPELAPTAVGHRFLALDLCPLAMACHTSSGGRF